MESSADGRNNSGLNPDEPVEREALISAIERTIEHDVTHWDSNAVVEEQAFTVALPEDIQLIQSSVSSTGQTLPDDPLSPLKSRITPPDEETNPL
mgnify:CR=1 FL=1